MVKLNDIPFSDIYITPDKTAFIGDNRTENGLKIIEAEDFEAFYNLVEKSWDGNNPSYSVLFERTFYRVERSLPFTACNTARVKCRRRFRRSPRWVSIMN